MRWLSLFANSKGQKTKAKPKVEALDSRVVPAPLVGGLGGVAASGLVSRFNLGPAATPNINASIGAAPEAAFSRFAFAGGGGSGSAGGSFMVGRPQVNPVGLTPGAGRFLLQSTPVQPSLPGTGTGSFPFGPGGFYGIGQTPDGPVGTMGGRFGF